MLRFATTLFTLLLVSISLAQGQTNNTQGEYSTNKCYIQLTQKATFGTQNTGGLLSELHRYPELNNLVQTNVISSVETSFKVLAQMDEELSRVFTLTITNPSDLETVIGNLNKLDYINFAEKIPVYKQFITPNDPLYSTASNRWHLDSIGAELGWDQSTGCANVTIAIVDDAVLMTHEDLSSEIYTNPGEIAGNGIDDDNNGYIDDVNGFDVADNDNNANPPATATSSFFTHGTHVAGIAGAASNNGVGIASIGFNSSIVPVKVKSNSNTTLGGLDAPMEGVEYAIAMNVDVINMSWGGYASSNAHQLVFSLAYSYGITCVAAVGNDGLSFIAYPANYEHVISVGATGTDDDFAPFTNFSQELDVFAPGVDVFSTLAGSTSDYGALSGTSMSSPLVAGLAALMICNDPTLDPGSIESCLRNSATLLPTVYNPAYQIRLINPAQAISCSAPNSFTCEPAGCEMVANGDFETPANSNITQYSGWSAVYDDEVCSWESYGGTADCFPNQIAATNNYGMVLYDGMNGGNYEGLVSPVLGLIPGREYILEFDYAVTGPVGNGQTIPLDSVVIGLLDNSYVFDIFNPYDPYDQIGSLLSPQVDVSWSSVFDFYDITLYDPEPYFHHYSMSFVAGPNVVNRGRLLVFPQFQSQNLRREVQFDNISLQPIIEVTALAVDTIVGPGNCTDVSATGSWDEYVWEPSYEFTNPAGNMQNVCPDSTLTYIVTAYDSLTGCSGSDSITIFVDSAAQVGTLYPNNVTITVYPNPVLDELTIQVEGELDNDAVMILDQNGKIIYEGRIPESGIMQINTSELSSGVYHCKVGSNSLVELVK